MQTANPNSFSFSWELAVSRSENLPIAAGMSESRTLSLRFNRGGRIY